MARASKRAARTRAAASNPRAGMLERRRARRPRVAERNREVPGSKSAPFTLADLAARIKERAAASAETSYTRKLLDQGVAHCAKKLGEEAVETALAAVGEDRERLIAETADLLYHLLVVLEVRGVALTEVEAALAGRAAQSGLEEKASRRRD